MKKESKNNQVTDEAIDYLEISGKVVKGRGEGKFFLSLNGYKQHFKEILGFVPFEGTLNLELSETETMKKNSLFSSMTIPGFKDGNRTFAEVYAYPCSIDGTIEPCALIVPIKTRHPANILEIVCPQNLREILNLSDGSLVKVKFWSLKKE